MNFDECKTMYKVMRNHLRKINNELFYTSSRKRRSKEDSYTFAGYETPKSSAPLRRNNRENINDIENALEILDYKCGFQALTSSSRELLGDIYNDYGEMIR